ncbi:MAG TPA: hypothetical protein VLC74_06700 [Rhizomicrobium sp.]|nr:hypothetical protein [Rhizomicrobium sp.]
MPEDTASAVGVDNAGLANGDVEMRQHFDLSTGVSTLAHSLYAIGVVAVCFLLGDELVVWLRVGAWQTLLTKDVVALPQSSWVGVQKISSLFGDLPLVATACVVFAMLGWSIQRIADRLRSIEKKRRLRISWPPPL